MKRLLFIISFFICSYANAGHIAGGELFYKYLGKGVAANSSRYQITLRLFRECNPVNINGQQLAPLPDSVYIGTYRNTNPSEEIGGVTLVNRTNFSVINLTTYNPCLIDTVPVCYQIGLYQFEEELPNVPEGYTVAYQTCCRSYSIVNVKFYNLGPYVGEGATYTCQIPGTDILGSTGISSSPQFYVKDTTLVCANSPFSLDFGAFDPDKGDSIDPDKADSFSYTFAPAFNRGNTSSAYDTTYSLPPFDTVTYISPFSGYQPLGSQATINSTSGIISGIAPDAGVYVVNVVATQWRQGKIISTHRKDFSLKVANCTLAAAKLTPDSVYCNSYTIPFSNLSSNSHIRGYTWYFGDSLSTPELDTSHDPAPTHIYSDTGSYNFYLAVYTITNDSSFCYDTARARVRVYPGFKAKFVVKSNCIKNPYEFIDSSYNQYGTIKSWIWNLGEPTVTTDTFSVRTPSYISMPYPNF